MKDKIKVSKTQLKVIELMKNGYVIIVSECMRGVGSRGGGWTSFDKVRLFKGKYGSDGDYIPIKMNTFESMRKKGMLEYIEEIRKTHRFFKLKKKWCEE